MQKPLDTVEINPQTSINYSIIWLHGLGADGHDFEPIVPELKLADSLGIRFVFPHAPVRPVTINGHMPMRAWYDIREMALETNQDELGIQDSCQLLKDLIDYECQTNQLSTEQIMLAGFSQGGAIALTTMLTSSDKYAGIIALSTYLPLKNKVEKDLNNANLTTNVFMAHGTQDPVVPFTTGTQTKDWLLEHHHNVDWHTYPMPHSVMPQEITDLSHWLTQQLA